MKEYSLLAIKNDGIMLSCIYLNLLKYGYFIACFWQEWYSKVVLEVLRSKIFIFYFDRLTILIVIEIVRKIIDNYDCRHIKNWFIFSSSLDYLYFFLLLNLILYEYININLKLHHWCRDYSSFISVVPDWYMVLSSLL